MIISLSRSYNITVKNAFTFIKRIDDFLYRVQVPEDSISGTLAHCTLYSLLYSTQLESDDFPKLRVETLLEKAQAAKIVSLAASLEVGSDLFFRPEKHLHWLYKCFR